MYDHRIMEFSNCITEDIATYNNDGCHLRKRKLVALVLMSYRCSVTINVLWLFLTVQWVGLQCEIVVFPDHTRFFGVEISLYVFCYTFPSFF